MAGAKLRLAAGTFVKVPLEVRNGGTLEANGTASEPVIFTSLADDSVGGDTGGASSTTPEQNIAFIGQGTLDLDHAELRDAQKSFAPGRRQLLGWLR